ncbi:hypothetical protein [Sedimentisphaera cyanobacteriorum]|nr:hypothetical protein [Sedimentisphaera cyanobacteriorum]
MSSSKWPMAGSSNPGLRRFEFLSHCNVRDKTAKDSIRRLR